MTPLFQVHEQSQQKNCDQVMKDCQHTYLRKTLRRPGKMQFNLNTTRGRDAYEDIKFFGGEIVNRLLSSKNWLRNEERRDVT